MPSRFAIAASLAAAAFAGVTGHAEAESITFDDLVHGEIVHTQYQASHGLTIAAENYWKSFDLAVAFDTNRSQTRDPDLENPWDRGNLPADADLGHALIIQENNNGIGDGVANKPDDEGRRPAGYFTFDFDRQLSSFGFSLIDVEGVDEYNGGYFLSIFDGQQQVAQIDFADLVTRHGADPVRQAVYDMYDGSNRPEFGNNSANQVLPLTSGMLGGTFDRVVIGLGGSGAIGDINFTAVPSPSAVGIGLVLLTAAGLRRRVTA